MKLQRTSAFRRISVLVAFGAIAIGAAACVPEVPPPTTQPPLSGAPAGCYRNMNGNTVDILYSGNPGTLNNAMQKDSVDGTCSGVDRGALTVVVGQYVPNVIAADAGATCASLGFSDWPTSFQDTGWTDMTNLFYCQPNV